MKKNPKNFGSTGIKYISPASLSKQVLNVGIGFKDALHLHLCLGQALQKLNRYNMATTQGKNAAVKLVIYGDPVNRIMVTEG